MKRLFFLCFLANLLLGDVGRVGANEHELHEENAKKVPTEQVNFKEGGECWLDETCNLINDTLPNIIILLADDLGYGDLSFSGHPTSRTPQLDQLARESRFFTHFYVTSPVCSPSRASLLTGRVQVRSGVYPGVFTADNTLGLPRNETTIATLLKKKGYQTQIVGKWHLGVGAAREYLPIHFGFDQYLGLPYSQDMCPCDQCFPQGQPCYDHLCSYSKVSCPLFRNSRIIEQPAYLPTLTQRLVAQAKAFISDAAASQQPFFLYFSFHHVHHPQFASEEFYGKSERGVFGDALDELDWAVSEVVDQLTTLGLINSTLLWFTSDNGPSLRRHERGGCAGLLRCGKGTTWEGGVRVPAFVHWPPYITPGKTSGLASTLDILPTLASLVHLDTSNLTLDGVDLSPLLRDPLAKSPRKMYAVYPQSPEQSLGPFSVTNGTYKAHFYTIGSDLSDPDNYDPLCPASHPLTPHDPPLLYNLYHDPGERYNLANDSLYLPVLDMLGEWREEHMKTMTWMEPRTTTTDPLAQPCCNQPSCQPFPECCDCPVITHPNHINSYHLQDKSTTPLGEAVGSANQRQVGMN
nr:arylsulfatase A-like isoform X1 [Cherax quadricarinatus]